MLPFASPGLVPFVALVILNFKIFKVIQRRKLIGSRLRNPQLAAVKRAAARHSYTLFAICALFLVCHSLRVGLAIHELYVLDHYKRSMGIAACNAVKLWTLVLGSVAQLMLTLNSSLNFAIYLLMSSEFRATVVNTIKTKTAQLLQFMMRNGDSASNGSSNIGSDRSSVCGAGDVTDRRDLDRATVHGSPNTQTRNTESSMLLNGEVDITPPSASASKLPVLQEKQETDRLIPGIIENFCDAGVALEMDECVQTSICSATGEHT